MLIIIALLSGLVCGALINVLADDLPRRSPPRRPHCPECDYVYEPAGWSAITQRLFLGGACPRCGQSTRRRALAVEVGTGLLFAVLAFVIADPVVLLIYAFYGAVLVLVIVIDIEHRLILHIVTIPVTIAAVLLAAVLPDSTLLWAAAGAATGFLLFYIFYWIGQLVYGPGALGFGDVMLSMTMGAMFGFDQIIFAIVFGILLGGLSSVVLIATGRATLRSRTAYGPYLAVAGLIMLLWGPQIVEAYFGA